MRAVRIREPGEPGVLSLDEVPAPTCGEGEVLVRVRAAGVNRADLLQRRGRYPAPPGWPADVPGLEYAGVVESVGPGVGRWHPGDRVMGLVGGGGYAERVVVHEGEALPVPVGIDLDEAAALPEALVTAHDALFTRDRVAIVGTVLRPRSLEEKIAATRSAGQFVLPHLESGEIRPVIDGILPMAEAAAAHRLMEADANFGKVVLSWEA